MIGRGFTWLDTGTPNSLQDAASYVRIIQERQGQQIGCIEEAAYRADFMNEEQLRKVADSMNNTEYGQYLLNLANKNH